MHYGGDMAIDLEELKLEMNRCRHRWSIREPTDPLPQTLVDTLDVANAALYPGIYVSVKTLLAYPVSAYAAECSEVEDATTKHDDRRSPFIVSNIAHPQGKRNRC